MRKHVASSVTKQRANYDFNDYLVQILGMKLFKFLRPSQTLRFLRSIILTKKKIILNKKKRKEKIEWWNALIISFYYYNTSLNPLTHRKYT